MTATTLVKESMALAEQGKVIGIPFAAQQNIGAVQSAWGKPDSQSAAGAGIYASYGSHAAAFGLNKGEQIFDVRSFRSQWNTVTQADVESVLGQPGETRHTSDSVIDMYPAGADYQLLFVFPKTSTGAAGKTVGHVSVFWPQGTVNLMAATQPEPSISIDHASVDSGSKLQFTIGNPPSGYRLVELEWVPTQGAGVVNTDRQAAANASGSSSNTGFATKVEGKAYSFHYASWARGQTGFLRVIYQDTAGTAMIGTSAKATLK